MNTNHKQPIAYFFTNSHIDVKKFGQTIKQLVSDIERDAKVEIHGILSDQSGVNVGLYNELRNIKRDVPSVNCFKHPVQSKKNRQLYLFHDFPHAIKNFRNCLMNSKLKFKLPEWFANENDVEAEISYDIFKLVKEIQSSFELQGYDKLTEIMVAPKMFDKMLVGPAVKLLSENTARTIRQLVHMNKIPLEKRELAKSTSVFVIMLANGGIL